MHLCYIDWESVSHDDITWFNLSESKGNCNIVHSAEPIEQTQVISLSNCPMLMLCPLKCTAVICRHETPSADYGKWKNIYGTFCPITGKDRQGQKGSCKCEAASLKQS